MDEKKKEPMETSEAIAILAGTCILVGGICYWIGFREGAKSARSAFIKTLNHAIEKGEIVISVETAGKAAKWFSIQALPDKPEELIRIGSEMTM